MKPVELRPVTREDASKILEVYRQCEDFLALGPVAHASLGMVMKDLEESRSEGGIFRGIYDMEENLIGVVDHIPSG